MTDLATIRGSLEQCYDAIESACARMSSQQWQAQSLCPDWDMRAVVTHLGMMERVMTGWLPDSAADLPPLDRIGPYTEHAASLDDKAFAARIAEIFADRRADLAGLREDDLARPSWTPIGPKNLRRSSWRSGSSTSGCTSATSPPHLAGPRRRRAEGRDLARPGRELDRLHRRQERSACRTDQHRVPPDRPDHSATSACRRRPRKGGPRRRRSPTVELTTDTADVHPAGRWPHRPPSSDRRWQGDLDREPRAGRPRCPQPSLHDLSACLTYRAGDVVRA